MKSRLAIKVGHRVRYSGSTIRDQNARYGIEAKVSGFHESGRVFIITDGGHQWLVPIDHLVRI